MTQSNDSRGSGDALRHISLLPQGEHPTEAQAALDPGLDPELVEWGARLDAKPATPILSRSLGELQDDPDLMQKAESLVSRFAVRGQLIMIHAREKCGKSTIARFLAALLTLGGVFLGLRVRPGRVLYVAAEESRRGVARALTRLHAHPARLFLISRITAERALDDLRAEMEAVTPDLVVIDTLSAFNGGRLPENDATAMESVLIPLRELAEDTETAILLLHHAVKNGEDFRGSTAIGGKVDRIIRMSKAGDDPTVRLFEVGGRLEDDEDDEASCRFALRRDRATGRYVETDVPPSERDAHRSDARAAATAAMLDHLRASPGAGKDETTAKAGIKAVAARELFDALVSEGAVVKHGRGYRLRDDPPAQAA